ncbi:hypothetical protein HUJ05_011069 [Dendroctonus ponderosae]|nr:hypothetical protein HUJ05_011069 [Dendroctonus ponderosae]
MVYRVIEKILNELKMNEGFGAETAPFLRLKPRQGRFSPGGHVIPVTDNAMRTKNFLVTLSVILTLSVGFLVFGQHKPDTIQSLVSSTNEQIQSFKDNLRDAESKRLVADQKLLDLLGFQERQPRLFPADVWRNSSLPVVVTMVTAGQESLAVGVVTTLPRLLPNNTILVYNLGLSEYGLKVLQTYCNSSRCQIVPFDLYDFPAHVQDEALHAYRPVVLQDALSRTGAILYVDSGVRFLPNVTHGLMMELFAKRALQRGVLTFPVPAKNPVTSLTHKKMFEYFRTDAENFQFLQMVRADVLFLVNTREVHQDIMLPWVQCALTQDCIFPIGAQSTGCNFDKKPSYRYSGCHFYDASALNIVLGLRFRFISNAYALMGAAPLFTTVARQRADALLREMEQNATSTDAHLQFVT